MDNGGKLVRCRLRIGEEKALRDLRKRITEGFGFVRKRYGEVAFELGDQVRDNRALKSCEIGEGKEPADVLYIVSGFSNTSIGEESTLCLP